VNFGTPVPLLVGIVLILIAVGLFFLEKFKPGYRRDSDTVYSILFLTVGILSLFQLNQEFLPSFQLMIFAGMLISLMIDNIRRRTPGNTPLYQGGNGGGNSGGGNGGGGFRNSPDRPSRSSRAGFEDDYRSEVRAEFDDEFMPMEESSRVRRIRGGREGAARDNYQSAYLDQLSEDTREPRRAQGTSGTRRPSNSYSDDDSQQQYGGGEESRTRRRKQPLQLEGDAIAAAPENSAYSYGEERPAKVEPSTSSGRRRGRSESSLSSSPLPESEVPASGSARSARRRSRGNGGDRPLDGDYVDYKPLGTPKPPSSDDDFDNSGNFDDNPGSFR
jgi:Ycf66 protein N-terminus